MKKTIFSLLLLAVCSLGASAQSADDLEPSTLRVCSKWELRLPILYSRKPKPTSLLFLCLLTAPIRKAHCCVLAVG